MTKKIFNKKNCRFLNKKITEYLILPKKTYKKLINMTHYKKILVLMKDHCLALSHSQTI